MFNGIDRKQVTMLCMRVGVVLAGCDVSPRWVPFGEPAALPPPQVPSARLAGSNEGVDISVVDAHEVDLVEAVLRHRARYHQNLRRLHDYYLAHGYHDKTGWAAFELKGLANVKRFRYLLDAEVPSDALRAVDQDDQADALYQEGVELMRRGGHGVPGIFRQDRMIQAADTFRKLIERYPGSDKIDDAAFLCGEIHKDYLPGQEQIAVKWYERAWTWNPDTPHPVRFQAAVLYDYRLHDRDRALELYQAVLKHETQDKSNVRFATRRIHELTSPRPGAGRGDS